MKVSAFTFIKNGQILGYPFLESIKSILPIVDEFIINVGKSEDDTLQIIKTLKDKKIRIIESKWNDSMKNRGYVYGQQKMISQFNCTGDWAFYIEGDEIYHEKDLEKIKKSMKIYLNDPNVEAIAFDFIHFYGNANSYLNSPGWYRSEARIIKTSIRSYAPDGLFWLVLSSNKKGRYPKAKKIGINCFHYGWVRSEEQMNLKSTHVQKYWNDDPKIIEYSQMDKSIIKEFNGTHPDIIRDWLPKEKGLFEVDSKYNLSFKQKKHRIMIRLEKLFGIDLSKKHYKTVR
ncbi:glycosyltransferase family 2 protein [Candidatus Pseudothioglobus singularis]|jgi:glycosyltransferase involved in cell wall biosynthesis|uniref:Glycosyltransferase n=1 Tax=Candidatus Pseudothioglobus singularis PS1 TaxID=1125411 RepID=A0A0M4LHJ1_9GAMM|nr:glycosyltransferase family 2 protein [Candidatus Pseudothioglobus singularis]ALE02314.1 glycosyltransferase [Candidatus Pseudothioglobus singularis PS1]